MTRRRGAAARESVGYLARRSARRCRVPARAAPRGELFLRRDSTQAALSRLSCHGKENIKLVPAAFTMLARGPRCHARQSLLHAFFSERRAAPGRADPPASTTTRGRERRRRASRCCSDRRSIALSAYDRVYYIVHSPSRYNKAEA